MPVVPVQPDPAADDIIDPYKDDNRPLIIIFIVIVLIVISCRVYEYWLDKNDEVDAEMALTIRRANRPLQPICVHPIRPFRPLPDDL
ncbi:Protein of unknown function [Pyronema omphalodes CBS 100304]|uniref:Uncharacterized protein n=1 Tax=Pyronema omphalodes (strain CBS 100304) TaxID=1076935 RepID=U4KWK1_PYROM|nr:Protein of unknown function [Pyronema omphalodes CBS 100304]